MTLDTATLLQHVAPAAVHWVVYTFLVWILLKVQKIQYNLAGVMAATALAVATTFIPKVGTWVSYVVLLFCLWKATKASFAPDILFTTAIAGALMFCFNLWVIAAIMPDLTARFHSPDEVAAAEAESQGVEEVVAVPAADASPPEPPPIPRVWEHDSGLTLRGISYSLQRPLAMVALEGEVVTVAPGEILSFDTRDGTFQARCAKIERSFVRLEFEGGEKVDLLID